MSSHSDTDRDIDSDYDVQTESPLGSEIPSIMNETHGSSATSVSPSATATATPSKALAEYAKGTFNPIKPLLLYVAKMADSSTQPKPGKQRGGTRHWKCNVCGHSWVGSYSRIKMHLLGVGGKGVYICSKLTILQKSELLRMQMAADAKGNFSSKNAMAQAHQNENIDEATSSKRKMKNMPPPGSRSCAVGPTLIGMYGKLNSNDIDDAIGKFLFANGIPFHVSRSPCYKEMVKAIATA